MTSVVGAYCEGDAAPDVARQVGARLGNRHPTFVVCFCDPKLDIADISGSVRASFPTAEVIGCSTAGEFTDGHAGVGGVACLALGADKVVRGASTMFDLRNDIPQEVARGIAEIESKLGVALRSVDPTKYVGILLIDGVLGKEESVNDALGNAIPMLPVVGGSAADSLAFKSTSVFANGAVSTHGAVFCVLEMGVPFALLKTCSFTSTGTTVEVTRCDEDHRIANELSGKSAREAYADAVGVNPEEVSDDIFTRHPLGLIVAGEPWIRSPRRMLEDGSMEFYCRIEQGMELDVMGPTDLIGDSMRALGDAREKLGGISGVIAFNCILRRLELDASGRMTDFVAIFAGAPTAGFHTYGESMLSHMNQTLTALVIG